MKNHYAIRDIDPKVKEINEAPDVLSNPAKRAHYDMSIGRTTLIPSPPQQRPNSHSRALTLAPGVTLDLVRIPAGVFLMGSTDADRDTFISEEPQHKVMLDEYLIGKHSVTNAQYGLFARTKRAGWLSFGQVNDPHWSMPSGEENHPVVNVSWDDAVAFCVWASQTTGQNVMLPTEAQWEKAARGTDGRIYPWGNETPAKTRCNFCNDVGATTPAGKYSPAGDSPYGVIDMAGNVWDWVSDWYDENYYANSPASNPQGPTSGKRRVVRGGSWGSYSSRVRATYRGWYEAYDHSVNCGFRVAVLGP